MVVVRRSWFVVVRPPIFQKSNEEEEVYEAKEFPQRHDRAMTSPMGTWPGQDSASNSTVLDSIILSGFEQSLSYFSLIFDRRDDGSGGLNSSAPWVFAAAST